MSADSESEIPPPGLPSLDDKVSVFEFVTRRQEVRRCFLMPLAVFVFIGIIARVLAPSISGAADSYSSFFSTAAQVIVAVFIALLIFMPMMGALLAGFMNHIAARIASL